MAEELEVIRVTRGGATIKQYVGTETIQGREVPVGAATVFSEGAVIKGADEEFVQRIKDGEEHASSLAVVLTGDEAQEAWDAAVDEGLAYPPKAERDSLGTVADRPLPGAPGQVGLGIEEFDVLEASEEELQAYLAKAPQSEQQRVLAVLQDAQEQSNSEEPEVPVEPEPEPKAPVKASAKNETEKGS